MRWARRIVILALFVGALYVCLRFPALNQEPVRVDYLVYAIEAQPLWLALLQAFVAGAVLAGLLALYPIAKARMLSRRYRKTARGLEAEVHELRNLPLAAEPEGEGRAAPLERSG